MANLRPDRQCPDAGSGRACPVRAVTIVGFRRRPCGRPLRPPASAAAVPDRAGTCRRGVGVWLVSERPRSARHLCSDRCHRLRNGLRGADAASHAAGAGAKRPDGSGGELVLGGRPGFIDLRTGFWRAAVRGRSRGGLCGGCGVDWPFGGFDRAHAARTGGAEPRAGHAGFRVCRGEFSFGDGPNCWVPSHSICLPCCWGAPLRCCPSMHTTFCELGHGG